MTTALLVLAAVCLLNAYRLSIASAVIKSARFVRRLAA